MRLFDIIFDRLTDIPLIEMAYRRKTAIDAVRSYAPTISLHLVKYYAFDDQAKNHWVVELDNYFEEINRIVLKPNNKKLSGDTYYSLLWDEPLNNGVGFITNVIERLSKKEYKNCKRSALTDAKIYENCEKILHVISYDIANNKYTDFKDYI